MNRAGVARVHFRHGDEEDWEYRCHRSNRIITASISLSTIVTLKLPSSERATKITVTTIPSVAMAFAMSRRKPFSARTEVLASTCGTRGPALRQDFAGKAVDDNRLKLKLKNPVFASGLGESAGKGQEI